MSPTTPTLAEWLRTVTADAHHRAEHSPFPQRMAKGIITPTEYARWLGELRVIHHAVESHFPKLALTSPDAIALIDIAGGKSQLIDADLTTLGSTVDAHEPLPSTTAFVDDLAGLTATTPQALIGALYVLEGSTNGNRFIAARLRLTLGQTDAFRYLDPYGDIQRQRWSEFKANLSALHVTEAQREAIVTVAIRTFGAVGSLGSQLSPHSASGD